MGGYTVLMEISTFSRDDYPPKLFEIPRSPKQLWIQVGCPTVSTRRLATISGWTLVGDLVSYLAAVGAELELGADACAYQAVLRLCAVVLESLGFWRRV